MISKGTLKTDFGVNNQPILPLKEPKEANLMGLWHFARVFIKVTVGRWKLAYFSVMTFRFKILTRSACLLV